MGMPKTILKIETKPPGEILERFFEEVKKEVAQTIEFTNHFLNKAYVSNNTQEYLELVGMEPSVTGDQVKKMVNRDNLRKKLVNLVEAKQ